MSSTAQVATHKVPSKTASAPSLSKDTDSTSSVSASSSAPELSKMSKSSKSKTSQTSQPSEKTDKSDKMDKKQGKPVVNTSSGDALDKVAKEWLSKMNLPENVMTTFKALYNEIISWCKSNDFDFNNGEYLNFQSARSALLPLLLGAVGLIKHETDENSDENFTKHYQRVIHIMTPMMKGVWKMFVSSEPTDLSSMIFQNRVPINFRNNPIDKHTGASIRNATIGTLARLMFNRCRHWHSTLNPDRGGSLERLDFHDSFDQLLNDYPDKMMVENKIEVRNHRNPKAGSQTRVVRNSREPTVTAIFMVMKDATANRNLIRMGSTTTNDDTGNRGQQSYQQSRQRRPYQKGQWQRRNKKNSKDDDSKSKQQGQSQSQPKQKASIPIPPPDNHWEKRKLEQLQMEIKKEEDAMKEKLQKMKALQEKLGVDQAKRSGNQFDVLQQSKND